MPLNSLYKKYFAVLLLALLLLQPVALLAEENASSSLPLDSQETLASTTTDEVLSEVSSEISSLTEAEQEELDELEEAKKDQEEEEADKIEEAENKAEAEFDEDAPILTETEGVNGSSSPAGEGGIIQTGDVFLAADVLNVVNTNVSDATGKVIFLNLSSSTEDIDVRPADFKLEGCQQPCSVTNTTIDKLIVNTNDAEVLNDVAVNADSGLNSASGTGSMIITGDATAAANIVNIVNTNIIGSEYLLLVLNNFGDLNNDVVLPGSEFFKDLQSEFKEQGQDIHIFDSITNQNQAVINSTSTIGAETGGNDILGTDGGIITTGKALTQANNVTLANTNLTGDNAVYILVKVAGDWNGTVYGLPKELSFERVPEGLVFFAKPVDGKSVSFNNGAFTSSSTLENNNNALIGNNTDVTANTGLNTITDSGSSTNSLIRTGDATAVSNVVNVINTNIVGKNWLTALINIFGDWNGNLSFGQPDLIVSMQAELDENPMRPGKNAEFTVLVSNIGDSPASNVIVENSFTPTDRFDITTKDMDWDLGTLEPGDSVTLTYDARLMRVENELGSIEHRVRARGLETESSLSNNEDMIAITVSRDSEPPRSGSGGGGGGGSSGGSSFGSSNSGGSLASITSSSGGGVSKILPKLTIQKTNDAPSLVSPSSTVHYTLTIKNDGLGEARNVMVKDIVRDPYGKVVQINEWPLETVFPREEVIIEYDVAYKEQVMTGWYINEAFVEGENEIGGTLEFTSAKSSIYIVKDGDQQSIPLLGFTSNPPDSFSRRLEAAAARDPKLEEAISNTVRGALETLSTLDSLPVMPPSGPSTPDTDVSEYSAQLFGRLQARAALLMLILTLGGAFAIGRKLV